MERERAINSQHSHPIVDPALVQRFIPDERLLTLYPPPFRTVADDYRKPADSFWDEYGALSEIDPTEALLIADFEIGSDSAVILDYRLDPAPALRLKHLARTGDPTRWVQIADSIDALLRMFEL